ncbi:MAG: pseudouridine synthase [Bacteroidales bacterium]|nr:pseudouridine synthase [Bacteroidales bacterium]
MEKRDFRDKKKAYGSKESRPKRNRREEGEEDHSRRKSGRKFSDEERPRRRFESDDEERPRRKFDRDDRPKRKFNREDNDRPRRSFKRNENTEEEPLITEGFSDGRRPRRKFNKEGFDSDRPRRKFGRDDRNTDRPKRKFDSNLTPEERLQRKLEHRHERDFRDDRSSRNPRRRRDVTAESEILTEIVARRKAEGRRREPKQKVLSLEQEELHGPMRLNKYIANAGICSRRDADILIETGAIMVNGEIVTELGTKVMPTDEVRYGDKILQREKSVYILLNKPKDYITTTYDDRERKDVMELIKGACREHVYPVGRLDKNTTGVLLFTNNGEMAKKLTHPRSNIQKIYHVELDKNLTHNDFKTIQEGIELEDGPIKPDEISYVGDTKNEIGITIHSGRNRIVRRIFESLDYKVVKLDRVLFAGLTKKDLPRGSWRFLSQEEVNFLNMLPKQNKLF